jgi:2-polyprenyl-6-methoxyphenol hydroxylase-like FAD-dependent oxidoreductase
MSTSNTVAIIGAGLSGLALALSLHQQGISSTLYESRPAPLDIGGAIMLSPNALRVLDQLGIYKRMLPLAYNFHTLHFYKDDGKPLDTFEFGVQKKHGYDAMRIYRFELINLLLEALTEAGIKPIYGKKFIRVTEENEQGVTWEFEDGTTSTAYLLIGADGIHSRVRSYIAPKANPLFVNMIGVSASIPASQLGPVEEDGFAMPLTIMNKTRGAFVAAPQRKDGSEIFIGRPSRLASEPDREELERMTKDKSWAVEFLREGLDDYPPIVGRAMSNIPLERVNLWPFYVIPKLESWMSPQGRVIILGDAAHALPPTAGQGINQAFEDIYTFSRVLSGIQQRQGDAEDTKSTLRAWQHERQERVDGILELNGKIDKRRLPAQVGETEAEVEAFELEWLYNVDFDETVNRILSN